MSQLVEDNFFANFQSDLVNWQQLEHHSRQVYDGLVSKFQRAYTEGYNFKICNSQRLSGTINAVAHIKFHSAIFDLVVQISIEIKKKKLKCRASFLEQEEYVITQSTAKRKLTCRKLLKINQQLESAGLKFIQDMQNGKIFLFTTHQESEQIFSSRDLIWVKVKSNLKKIHEAFGACSMQILQILDRQKFKLFYLRNGGQELKKIRKEELSYAKLLNQIQISHIDFGFSSKADQSSYPAFQKSKKQQLKLRDFIMNISRQKFESDSKRLFLTERRLFYEFPSDQISYEMQHAQSTLYSSYLKTPPPKDPHPGENKFIFNHIEVLNAQKVKFRDSSYEGGKNKIGIAKLSFYYCQSAHITAALEKQSSLSYDLIYRECFKMNQQTTTNSINPVLTKMIAVKIPKRSPTEKWDYKYENQKNIIKLFKSGASAYILKYYVSKQLSFQYRDYLLMDYMPNSLPLSSFIQIFRETLSLNSKMHILVNLSNSLRFIGDYQIVHMDLNLNNILVYREYLTKLIDFGEAYSDNITASHGSSFKRGYTFPFSSPQYFQRKQNFTKKQDIFSLGIIIFRIIFNQYPFFPSKSLQKTYRDKSYAKKLFLAPQRGQAFGNTQTIQLLYNIIFKCINPNENVRCQPSWVTILMKIIYYNLI